jgi:hypothetical protein
MFVELDEVVAWLEAHVTEYLCDSWQMSLDYDEGKEIAKAVKEHFRRLVGEKM